MAGQPVKRGNWGDWAVIERTPRSKKRCCGGCVHYRYEDDSCDVRPIVVYEVGADFWKTCPQYCTKCHFIVKAQYIRYLSEHSFFRPQESPATSAPKTRYKPNPLITVGMDIIDCEHNIGKVRAFDYKTNKIYIKYSSGTVEYKFPDVFINHQLKKYYKGTGESLVIDYFQIISNSSTRKNYRITASSTEPNLEVNAILRKTALAQAKNVHDLEISDFVSGMYIYHIHKGIGTIDSTLTFQNQISVRFRKERVLFRVPLDFTNGTLALINNPASLSSKQFKQLRANLLAQIKPTALKIHDFKCGMEIADIKYGFGEIDKIIYKDNIIWITFSDWERYCFISDSYKVPDAFVNGRLKIVIE